MCPKPFCHMSPTPAVPIPAPNNAQQLLLENFKAKKIPSFSEQKCLAAGN